MAVKSTTRKINPILTPCPSIYLTEVKKHIKWEETLAMTIMNAWQFQPRTIKLI